MICHLRLAPRFWTTDDSLNTDEIRIQVIEAVAFGFGSALSLGRRRQIRTNEGEIAATIAAVHAIQVALTSVLGIAHPIKTAQICTTFCRGVCRVR